MGVGIARTDIFSLVNIVNEKYGINAWKEKEYMQKIITELETPDVIKKRLETVITSYSIHYTKLYDKLRVRFFTPNILSRRSRGGLFIMFFSSGSASKTVEHAGSIINSRNAMCAGKRIRGKLNSMGNTASPAIGIWTEKM